MFGRGLIVCGAMLFGVIHGLEKGSSVNEGITECHGWLNDNDIGHVGSFEDENLNVKGTLHLDDGLVIYTMDSEPEDGNTRQFARRLGSNVCPHATPVENPMYLDSAFIDRSRAHRQVLPSGWGPGRNKNEWENCAKIINVAILDNGKVIAFVNGTVVGFKPLNGCGDVALESSKWKQYDSKAVQWNAKHLT